MTSPDNSPSVAAEAREVAQAVDRLLTGAAYRSSGHLTVVALADEAGVRRTRLYEQHRQLVNTFLERAGQGRRAPANGALDAQLRTARSRIAELESEATVQAERVRALMATVVELSLLLDPSTNVFPLRGPL